MKYQVDNFHWVTKETYALMNVTFIDELYNKINNTESNE